MAYIQTEWQEFVPDYPSRKWVKVVQRISDVDFTWLLRVVTATGDVVVQNAGAPLATQAAAEAAADAALASYQ